MKLIVCMIQNLIRSAQKKSPMRKDIRTLEMLEAHAHRQTVFSVYPPAARGTTDSVEGLLGPYLT